MSRFATSKPAATAPDTTPLDVTVGIDFGTSSAKLAFREFGGLQSILVPSPRSTLLWPCTVRIEESSFHFAEGDDETVATSAGTAPTIRWLKMLLAEEYGAERDGFRDHMRSLVASTGCSVQCVATLLLAYLMRHANERATRYFAARGRPAMHFTYNVGAPLETFAAGSSAHGHGTVSDGFLIAAYRAEMLAEHVPLSGGWPIEEARRLYDAMAKQFCTVPADASRNVFIVPETHAVVTGAVLARRRLETGHYAVVDVGAGTTDVAVFLYNTTVRKEGRWAVTYLADAVKHEASTHVDRCIAELIRERIQDRGREPPSDTKMLEIARQVKERSGGQQAVQTEDGVVVSGQDLRECVQELSNRLFRHYQKTLIVSLSKKTLNGLNQPFHLLLLGGGSRFVPFRERFRSEAPDPNHAKLQPIETWVSLRDHLRVLTETGTAELPERDYELYSLVHGLTTHIVRLPGFWRPDDVDNMPLPPDADRSPYMRNDDD